MKMPWPALSVGADRNMDLSRGRRVARVWQAGHLLLAMLLALSVTLAAAMYAAGGTAHAQGSDMTPATATEIWSATLRPYGNQWQSGCFNNFSNRSHHCSSADRLTDDDFSFAGTDYSVVVVSLLSIGWLGFEFDKVPADVAVEDLTLHVGERTFPFRNGKILRASRKGPRWTDSGLSISSWSAGSSIALRITAPTATAPGAVQSLRATAGNRQVVLTWRAPQSNGGSRILDYEFRYSEGSTVPSSAAWSSAGMDFTETISGLTKGQQYAFEVRARNRVGGGAVATATATLAANSVPTASSGIITTREDTKYPFQASDFNFTDTDAGDAFTSIQVVTLPPSMKGRLNLIDTTVTAVQAGDVVNKADIDAGKLTYAPPVNEHGSPYTTFTFTVSDGFESSTPASTMTVNVASVPDVPLTEDATVTTTEDAAYTFQAGDFSFADADGDTLSGVKVLTLPPATKGALTVDGAAVSANQSVPAADIVAGRLVFTPVADGNGDPYTSFAFKVSDGALESAGAATMTIDVTAVNDPAAGKPSISGAARVGQYLKAVTTGITDVDGMAGVDFTYQWVRVTGGSDADITGATSSTYKLVAADLNKQVKVRVGFTDNDGTAESPLTSDAWPSGGTVQAQDDAVPALSIAGATALEGGKLRFRVTLTAASEEEVMVDYASSDGTATAGDDYTAVSGTLTFAPSETEKTVIVGTTADDVKESRETITLTLSKPIYATLADSTATGTMTEHATVVGRNNLPTASDNTITIPEDAFYSFKDSDWGFNDEDERDELHFIDAVSLPPAETGLVFKLRGGGSKFRPAPNWHGTTHIRFRVSDGEHLSRRTYTMTINVTPVNDEATGKPVINGVRQVGQTLTASTAEIADADGLPDSFAYEWFRAGADGTSNPVDGTPGPVSIPGANSSTYTLVPADMGKRLLVRVSFTDRDGSSEQLTSGASGTVKARGVGNAVPAAADARFVMDEDTDHIFRTADFGFADTDSGDALVSVKVLTLPAAGALLLDGDALTAGATVTSNDMAAGRFVFRPAPNAHGAPYASFTFKVSDGTAESASANTIAIDVTSVNDPATGKPWIRWVPHESFDVNCCGHHWLIDSNQIADADGMSRARRSYRWGTVGRFGPIWETWSGYGDISLQEITESVVGTDEDPRVVAQVRFTDDEGNVEILTSDQVTVKRPKITSIALIESGKKVRITFSESVTVSGFPTVRVIMDNGEPSQVVYIVKAVVEEDSRIGTSLMFKLPNSGHFGESLANRSVRSVLKNGLRLNDAYTTIRSTARTLGAVDAVLLHDAHGSSTQVEEPDPPTVSATPSVADPDDGAWSPGDTVQVTVTFSEAVDVDTTSGTPSVEIGLGGPAPTKEATYTSGSGTTELVFEYTLGDDEGSHTSMFVIADSLELNGGTIRSTATDTDATLTHNGAAVQAETSNNGPRGQGGKGDPELTAAFEALPDHHDGSTPFTFGLVFSEPAVDSWRTVAGGLLDVTGGSVTHARRTNPTGPDRGLRWTITIEPAGNGDIGITLPVRACTDANAACIGTRALAQAVTATVAARPFTGSFAGVPAEHGGSGTFTMEFHLSEAPKGMSWRSVRDHLFDVTGGSIDRAQRTGPVRNRGWRLTIAPAGNADVTLTLRATTSCDDEHGVCTSDGRMLKGGVSATIRGPATFSVADAEVEEAEGATLDFTVTLSRSRATAATVGYATSDGTAVAGSDYTAASDTLTFAAGETTKTVSVAVLDDAHDEDSETLTFTLSNPVGAVLDDSEATGTISNDDPMPGAWIARFGRTVGNQVVEALGARLDDTPSSHLVVVGVSLGGVTSPLEPKPLTPQDWLAEQLAQGPDAHLPEGRTLTGRDLLLGSSFHLVSQDGESRRGPVLSAWGRVTTGGFQSELDGVQMDGDVTTGFLGFDAEWEGVLAGVLLSRSEGKGAFSLADSSGRMESALSGVYPYARLLLGGGVSVWGVLGAGSGDLRLSWKGDVMDTGLGLQLGALGVTGSLLEGGAIDLSVKSDALWVRTESDAAAGFMAASTRVSRVRVMVEGGRTLSLSASSTLTPTLEVGVRHDGGDAETGTGVEVGAGVVYQSGILSVQAQVRRLVAHESAGYEEWGASGSVRLSPGSSSLGPSVALMPSWGVAAGGAAQLWARPDGSSLVPAAGAAGSSAGRVDAELGWGLSSLRGRGVLTPYARAALAEGYDDSWHLGARLSLDSSLDLSLEGSRRTHVASGAAYDLALRASMPW